MAIKKILQEWNIIWGLLKRNIGTFIEQKRAPEIESVISQNKVETVQQGREKETGKDTIM